MCNSMGLVGYCRRHLSYTLEKLSKSGTTPVPHCHQEVKPLKANQHSIYCCGCWKQIICLVSFSNH